MKVLVSAFFSAPDTGSESEVGLRTILAAACRHDVWVLTHAANVPPLREAVDGAGVANRVELVGLALSPPWEWLFEQRLGLLGFHLYHDRWQREASRVAAETHRAVGFDVVHHVTVAAYWTRAGVANLDAPLVWGPVGGGVEAPIRLLPMLGLAGSVEEAMRFAGRRLMAGRPVVSAARRAGVVLTQNRETARRLGQRSDVMPHGTSVDVTVPTSERDGERRRDVVFAARLIPWKGGTLAVRAMTQVRTDAVLRVFGDGPERPRLERLARRLGVADRIRFEGLVPHSELLEHIRSAGALLHPALHDESPLVVAEALTLGTPVVCLAHGGPRELVNLWPTSPAATVVPSTPSATAARLGQAVDGFLAQPPPHRADAAAPTRRFDHEVLRSYDEAAAGWRSQNRTAPVVPG
ncbi:MAG: glycosyltransferase [Actinomycetota bacterium]|nr:glycosyltransferase [Actinomycetota bacterium]